MIEWEKVFEKARVLARCFLFKWGDVNCVFFNFLFSRFLRGFLNEILVNSRSGFLFGQWKQDDNYMTSR